MLYITKRRSGLGQVGYKGVIPKPIGMKCYFSLSLPFKPCWKNLLHSRLLNLSLFAPHVLSRPIWHNAKCYKMSFIIKPKKLLVFTIFINIDLLHWWKSTKTLILCYKTVMWWWISTWVQDQTHLYPVHKSFRFCSKSILIWNIFRCIHASL